MKNRRRQRTKRRNAAKQAEEAGTPRSFSQTIEELIGLAAGLVLGLAVLYWFYSNMWAACVSWLP